MLQKMQIIHLNLVTFPCIPVAMRQAASLGNYPSTHLTNRRGTPFLDKIDKGILDLLGGADADIDCIALSCHS